MSSWDYYTARKVVEIFRRRVLKKQPVRYAGRDIVPEEQGNCMIGEMIRRGEPFAASRFGSTELSVILRREAKRHHRYLRNNDSNLCTLSGFFPDDEKEMDKFSEMMYGIVPDIDLLGVWFSSLEEYVVGEYMPDAKLTYLGALEPYGMQKPWSENLAGRKVLVIHPFKDSIEKQYRNREKLFPDERILPEFELIAYRAVQTLAGEKDERFGNWFEALDYMKSDIAKIDFDIAVIGCGAYGMPLAVEVKRMGKQAVHMGGATQILFGIKGARWDENDGVSCYYNEYWTRPDKSEHCKDGNAVEGGCYW